MNCATERRQLARAARDAFPPMGVYAIRDGAGATLRVGSSTHVHGTLNRARFALRLGSHPDKALQAAWNRNAEAWSFEVLDLLRERKDQPGFDYAGELQALEQLYRDELQGGTP
jgi:hypothetical protein